MVKVKELIALLQQLPADQQEWYVGCTYDADCAWTAVLGIDGPHDGETEDGVEIHWIRLQGE